MSKEWKLIRIIFALSDFSVEHLEILLAMVKLELKDRGREVKNG